MAVKLLSESVDATITDDDQIRIDAVVAFWFKEQELSAPQIDRRMDIWFGEDEVFDLEIRKEFADEVEMASEGQLDHWSHQPRGRLALILLLDQFRRNIYRNSADAFAKDNIALKLCVQGARDKIDKRLPSHSKCKNSLCTFSGAWQRPYRRRIAKHSKRWRRSPNCITTSSSNSAVFRIATNCSVARTRPRKRPTWPATAPISAKTARLDKTQKRDFGGFNATTHVLQVGRRDGRYRYSFCLRRQTTRR